MDSTISSKKSLPRLVLAKNMFALFIPSHLEIRWLGWLDLSYRFECFFFSGHTHQ